MTGDLYFMILPSKINRDKKNVFKLSKSEMLLFLVILAKI